MRWGDITKTNKERIDFHNFERLQYLVESGHEGPVENQPPSSRGIHLQNRKNLEQLESSLEPGRLFDDLWHTAGVMGLAIDVQRIYYKDSGTQV